MEEGGRSGSITAEARRRQRSNTSSINLTVHKTKWVPFDVTPFQSHLNTYGEIPLTKWSAQLRATAV